MELSFIENSFLIIVAFILLLLGIIGSILPILPGFILSYIGLMIVFFIPNTNMTLFYPILFAILGIIAFVLNYYLPSRTTKKYGGTRYGSIGSVTGSILGFFFIPIPIGFLIGMIIGVYIGELLHDKNNKQKAWQSTKGSLIGFFYGVGFNFCICFAMLMVSAFYSIKLLY